MAANSSSRSVSCCVNRQPGCYGAARASAPTMTKLYRHYLPCFLHKDSAEEAVFFCKALSGTPADLPSGCRHYGNNVNKQNHNSTVHQGQKEKYHVGIILHKNKDFILFFAFILFYFLALKIKVLNK